MYRRVRWFCGGEGRGVGLFGAPSLLTHPMGRWLCLGLLLFGAGWLLPWLPVGALAQAKGERTNPLKNFDYAWKRFDQRYAFFKLRGVDWAKSRKVFRARLTARSSQVALYRVLKDMTDQLRDYHVTLEAPAHISRGYKGSFNDSPYSWWRSYDVSRRVARHYVDAPKSYANGRIRWGMVRQSKVGYLQINEMEDLVNCQDLRRLAPYFFCSWWTRETSAVSLVMDQVLDDLKQARDTIIDVRFNTGGYDFVSRRILSYFVSKQTRVYHKQTKFKDGWSKKWHFYLHPNPRRMPGRVFVLTSHITASAAEVFSLSAMHLKHVTLIGTRTRGILSDMYTIRLPNGWKITLSHQIYRDAKGKVYEQIGVPPDVAIPYPVAAPKRFYRTIERDLRRGGDKAIEAALKLIHAPQGR